MNWQIKPIGIIEWFIPAIIGYQLIHRPHHTHTLSYNKNDIYGFSLSSDSKKPINKKNYKKLLNSPISKYIFESKLISNNTFDITTTTFHQIPKEIDIFTYSFPCQDLSIQGKQKGMEKNKNTRSSLLWEIERILTELKSNYSQSEMPKYLLMENVASMNYWNN